MPRVPAQKNIDLGGESAWRGGTASLNAAKPKDVIYFFAQQRLRAISKVTAQTDPTRVVEMNFEAMLLAIEQMSPTPTMTFDHLALRGLYAKHTGGLTPEQAALVSEWEKSPAGQHVGNYLREVLCTSWREVPAVYFGDSGPAAGARSTWRTFFMRTSRRGQDSRECVPCHGTG